MIDLVSEMDIMKMIATASRGCSVPNVINLLAVCTQVWLPDGYSQIFRSYVFGPSGFLTMAPLRYAAKFDPFLSLDCAPTPSTLAQTKERKGSNFAIWQP